MAHKSRARAGSDCSHPGTYEGEKTTLIRRRYDEGIASRSESQSVVGCFVSGKTGSSVPKHGPWVTRFMRERTSRW